MSLVNRKFGKLIVTSVYNKPYYNRKLDKYINIKYAETKCDCGNVFHCKTAQLQNGKQTQCTICKSANRPKKKPKKLYSAGDKFGKLTVIESYFKEYYVRTRKIYVNMPYSKCKCDCGNVIECKSYDLKYKLRLEGTECKTKNRKNITPKTKEEKTLYNRRRYEEQRLLSTIKDIKTCYAKTSTVSRTVASFNTPNGVVYQIFDLNYRDTLAELEKIKTLQTL